jgi:hypothetical protein
LKSSIRLHLSHARPSAGETYLGHFRSLLASNKRWPICETADAHTADISIITDVMDAHDRWWRLETLHAHPLIASRNPRTFVYNQLDTPWCSYQGLYTSMPRRWFNSDRQKAVAFCYLPNPGVLIDRPERGLPKRLAGFMGAINHPVRRQLLEINDRNILIVDTSAFNIYNGDSSQQYLEQYVNHLLDSKFVLCPRGVGVSSMRLFEVLAMGRVPVIIGDDYILPEGPRWSDCSIRVIETDIPRLPDILSNAESLWPMMAEAAADAYHRWFSPDVLLSHYIDCCYDLLSRKQWPESTWCRIPDPQLQEYRIRHQMQMLRRRWHHFSGSSPSDHPVLMV